MNTVQESPYTECSSLYCIFNTTTTKDSYPKRPTTWQNSVEKKVKQKKYIRA